MVCGRSNLNKQKFNECEFNSSSKKARKSYNNQNNLLRSQCFNSIEGDDSIFGRGSLPISKPIMKKSSFWENTERKPLKNTTNLINTDNSFLSEVFISDNVSDSQSQFQ